MTHHNTPHNNPYSLDNHLNHPPQGQPQPQNMYATAPQKPRREFTRSLTDRWMGGVCGGLAQYLGWSSGLMRLLFVLSILIPGPQVIYYIAAWIIVPKEGENALHKFGS